MTRIAIALIAGLALCGGAALANKAAETTAEIVALDADLEAGQAQYKRECRACHGPTGKGLSSYPKLRDQTAEYIVEKLVRYRAGERFGPNTPLMAPRAKKLSDSDIANIAAFVVSLN